MEIINYKLVKEENKVIELTSKGSCLNCLNLRNKQDLSGFSCVEDLELLKDVDLFDSCDKFKTGLIELLTEQNQINDPCSGCLNNKVGQFNVCHCTLPYINQVCY